MEPRRRARFVWHRIPGRRQRHWGPIRQPTISNCEETAGHPCPRLGFVRKLRRTLVRGSQGESSGHPSQPPPKRRRTSSLSMKPAMTLDSMRGPLCRCADGPLPRGASHKRLDAKHLCPALCSAAGIEFNVRMSGAKKRKKPAIEVAGLPHGKNGVGAWRAPGPRP
jgi:hypothetical protein